MVESPRQFELVVCSGVFVFLFTISTWCGFMFLRDKYSNNTS